MKSLKAYEEIRDKILIGEKLPGTRLILSDLEAEMGIGRGLIREAFIRPWTLRFHITPMPYWAQRILGRRRGAKWHYAAPPPTGNGPGRNRKRHNWPVPITHRGGLY